MRVPGTSLKPSRAALPVSPEVAVRMTASFPPPAFCRAVVRKWGKICRAMSLKAQVGPCQSSSSSFSSLLPDKGTSFTGQGPPNFSGVYARLTQASISASVKSVRNLEKMAFAKAG